ncbi:MAG: SGNH/GDSL hydrolase family protein [Planctomycetota bacterium]
MTAERRRRRRFALFAALISTAASLALGEVVARLAGRRPLDGDPSHAYLWAEDTALGLRNRPFARIHNGEADTWIETGPHGERKGVGWDAAPVATTVIFVGDSTTLCAEVADDETCPSQVARRLSGGTAVRVVNAGVRGYSTLQSLRMADEWLERAPVRLVVYQFCDNDFIENVIALYGTEVPLAALAGDELRIHEPKVAPLAPGEAWRSPIRVGRGSRALTAARRSSALFETLYRPIRAALARASGVPAVDATAWKEVVRRAEDAEGHAVLARLLRELARRCRERGATLLVSRFTTSSRPDTAKLWPPLPTRKPVWETVVATCREVGVECVDPSHAFTDDEEGYCKKLRHGRYDGHYGEKGARTWAEQVAPSVERLLRTR